LFDKVGENEVDGILQAALGAIRVAGRQIVARLSEQVVAEEQATDGVLDTTAHVHHVLHQLLNWCALDGHVSGAHCDHQVEAGNDIAGILDELVQVGEVVHGVVLLEVDREITEGIEDGHVELVVLLRAEAACPELRDEGRAAKEVRQRWWLMGILGIGIERTSI
jgi:hypothetical protein